MKRNTVAALVAATLCSTARADEPADMLDQAPSRFAKLGELRVHFKSFGEGPTAVVFIHGTFCDLTTWRLQVPAFVDKAQVILIDLPGHGHSDKPKVEYNMNLFAQAVDAVLKEAGAEKALLVGHSMGTSVARQFYRRYPEKTVALVAVEGMLVVLPFAAPEAVKKLDGKEVRDSLLGSIDTRFGHMAAAVREEMKAVIAATPDHVADSVMRGLGDPAIWNNDPISVPVQMILAAGRYSIWPPDYEQQVRKMAPQLDFRKISDSGHCVMIDKPKEFNDILGEFLKEQGAIMR